MRYIDALVAAVLALFPPPTSRWTAVKSPWRRLPRRWESSALRFFHAPEDPSLLGADLRIMRACQFEKG